MARVFISYSREDQELAERLRERLMLEGVEVWTEGQLAVGRDWRQDISAALKAAEAVIVLVTASSLRSEWVTHEWSEALGASKRVIPAFADDVDFEALPPGLREVQGVDLSRNFDQGVRQIVEAVGGLARSAEPPPPVDYEAMVEEIVDRKLTSLGVEAPRQSGSYADEDPSLVFVVASFEPDMEPAFEAIETAARAVGLRAERVKDVAGDYRITDRILESIQRASLIVVDLTHERPNVYFELGYARGLGKTVVTIMREGTQAHFDVRDWTHMSYADSRPLERDLLERFRFEVEQRDQ